jgi:hypothetical protein
MTLLTAENAQNCQNGILAMPAGTEINVRTVGINRPTSADTSPCLRKLSLACSMSAGDIVS